jgi:nucleoside 2-deoxyribosyltransferase
MTTEDGPGQACPLCGNEARSLVDVFRCPVCGRYQIDAAARAELQAPEASASREILSGLARHHSERGELLQIFAHNWRALVASAPTPRTLPEALENLLLHIGERQTSFSGYVTIPPRRFPITVARGIEDFVYVARMLLDLGYAELYDDGLREDFRLTPAGWKRLDELRAARPDSRRAFVAMWFSDELAPAWAQGIRPGLEDAGYVPVRLDAVEHNEKIDDRIVAEIRRSGLVVADLTGGRANVYFEAGFAMGLGIPVIWTCREDHLDDLHFDTRQYNYIGWETPAELRERLRLRIEATLPRKP